MPRLPKRQNPGPMPRRQPSIEVLPEVLTTDEALKRVPHLPAGESQLILVTGRKRFGKSVFVFGVPEGETGPIGYIEEREPRVLVFDIHDENPRLFKRVAWRDALRDMETTDGPCRRRFVPPMRKEERESFADEFFGHIVEKASQGVQYNMLLVMEEGTAFFKSTTLRGTDFEQVILQGRHWGIRVLVVAQRLMRIPGELHSEATEIVIYNTKRPRDLDILEEWGLENAHEVAPHLHRGECFLIES